MSTDTLLPCPHCGCTSITIEVDMPEEVGWTSQAMCDECNACGPDPDCGADEDEAREFAIAAWNRRATPSAPADEAIKLERVLSSGYLDLLRHLCEAPTMQAGYDLLADWCVQCGNPEPVALKASAPSVPEGYWTASVTDNRPGKRRGETNPRVLRIHGRFPSEEAALKAAEGAITAGWVAEHMVHRETAKAHADFNLPQQEINRIGRLSAAPSHGQLGAEGWRPIETAPKDGGRVLLFAVPNEVPSLPPIIKIGRWKAGDWHSCWLWEGSEGQSYCPTHWMPLPAPPSAQSGA